MNSPTETGLQSRRFQWITGNSKCDVKITARNSEMYKVGRLCLFTRWLYARHTGRLTVFVQYDRL